MKRLAKLCFTIINSFIAFNIVILICLSWLDHFNFFQPDSPFYGLDFLPPIWLSLLVLPVSLIYWLLHYRRFAIILTGFFLLYFFVFDDFGFIKSYSTYPIKNTGSKKISVAALNVQYYSYGLDKVINVIKTIDADVTLLSENVLSNEQFKIVKEKLYPARFYMGRKESTAIISKYPVIEFNEVVLPSHQASLSGGNDIEKQHLNPNRSFSHAVLEVAGFKLNVISVRFLAGRPKNKTISERYKWSKYVLATQLQEVKFFKNYVSKLKGPVIFGGDLNAPPSSKTIKKLRQIATDAYLEDHIWGGYTFTTELPSMRLDYLFSMNNVVPVKSEMIKIKVSDHYPVFAEFFIQYPYNLLTNINR